MDVSYKTKVQLENFATLALIALINIVLLMCVSQSSMRESVN